MGLILIILGWALTLRSWRLLLVRDDRPGARRGTRPHLRGALRRTSPSPGVGPVSRPHAAMGVSTGRARVMTLAALVVALPLAGRAYETYADGHTRRTFQAPGMLVDVGGRRLHLLCIGAGPLHRAVRGPWLRRQLDQLGGRQRARRFADDGVQLRQGRDGMERSGPAHAHRPRTGARPRHAAGPGRIARAVRAGGLVGRGVDGRVFSASIRSGRRPDLSRTRQPARWSTSWSRRSSAAPVPPHRASRRLPGRRDPPVESLGITGDSDGDGGGREDSPTERARSGRSGPSCAGAPTRCASSRPRRRSGPTCPCSC